VQQALAGDIDVLLANLVISLGMDLHGLNHMIMLGVPRSFTEFVQTAGRTGRGAAPGHVQIILQPYNPRDAYLYRHFHAILSDVAGYYDVLPVRSTNLFCASEIFGNVAKSILTALCLRLAEPRWPHADGVRAVVNRLNGRLQTAMARILGNDPALEADIRALVESRLRRLQDDLARHGSFLSKVMRVSEVPWLLYGLRAKLGHSVRVTCVDQPLLDRLQAPAPNASEVDVEIQEPQELEIDEE
jgi:Helicase conserved C-terminal domain